jgi:hypothetical protein
MVGSHSGTRRFKIEWYRDGKLNRFDGPAIEFASGSKRWYLKGELSRLDGPAIDNVDGYRAWYIDGKEYTFEKFLEATKPKVRELTLVEVSTLLGYEVQIVK